MAIQIWDAQAGQYKSADLARFGGSGTLTEALVWDGTQYVKVWSATITITPQAPTFLTESPWYTLPTQAGVTYTMSGTPGYGQSVTVTATPQVGYELAGQTSWTHTYGPDPLPVVSITGTSGNESRDQFRAACIAYGTTYQTVQELPFRLDTSQATVMTNTFSSCSALTTMPNLDTSQVTIMTNMFLNCSSLTTVPSLDTSKVTTLSGIFYGCSSLTTVPNLDTSQATNMSSMFANCSALTTVPNLDTSQVTNMSQMFYLCSSLTTVPSLDTSKVTDMYHMFSGCSSLFSVPDLETSQVTMLISMFRNCSSLTDWDVRLIGRHPNAITTDMITGAALSREPFEGADGTITGRTLTNNVLTTLATHTITAAAGGNLKLLQMTLAWGNATSTKSIRIDRNGVQVATATGQNPVATVEVVCNVGDVITYKATVNSTTTANRVINSGTWGAWTR